MPCESAELMQKALDSLLYVFEGCPWEEMTKKIFAEIDTGTRFDQATGCATSFVFNLELFLKNGGKVIFVDQKK